MLAQDLQLECDKQGLSFSVDLRLHMRYSFDEHIKNCIEQNLHGNSGQRKVNVSKHKGAHSFEAVEITCAVTIQVNGKGPFVSQDRAVVDSFELLALVLHESRRPICVQVERRLCRTMPLLL